MGGGRGRGGEGEEKEEKEEEEEDCGIDGFVDCFVLGTEVEGKVEWGGAKGGEGRNYGWVPETSPDFNRLDRRDPIEWQPCPTTDGLD